MVWSFDEALKKLGWRFEEALKVRISLFDGLKLWGSLEDGFGGLKKLWRKFEEAFEFWRSFEECLKKHWWLEEAYFIVWNFLGNLVSLETNPQNPQVVEYCLRC